MSEFRILDFNFVQDSTVTLTASSEDPEFPATNIANPLRPKVWRSAKTGNFVIDATNDNIDFDEGGGELNATIASGTFTASTLATAIKTALEAAGAETYTITFSLVTGKWTIATGGATLSLLWDTGTNTATSVGASIGFDVSSDDTGSLTYTAAAIAIHTQESVVIDLQTEESIDSFAMVFDPVDGIKFTEDVVLKLQANATLNFTSPSVDVTLSIDQTYSTITHFFTSAQDFRYWRVQIIDPKNSNLQVEFSKIMLSFATQLTQSPEIGFVDKLMDQSRSQQNDYGHQYFDVFPVRRSFTFNYAALTESDLEKLWIIYNRVGTVTPIGISLDPIGTIFDKDRFFMYGRFTKAFKSTNVFFTFFDNNIEILEAM